MARTESIARGVAEQIIKNLARLATTRLLALLVSKASFFGLSFINPIAGFLISLVVTAALEKTFLGAMLLYIRIDTSRKLNAVEEIIKEIQDKGDDLNPDEIAEFDDKLDRAAGDLIRLD